MEEQTMPETTGATSEPTSTPADSTSTTFSAADLTQRLQQLEQDSTSYKDQYLRTAADLKNYKRRVEQERGELIRSAGATILTKLLPLMDDLDLAMQHVPAEVAGTPWFGGLQGVQRKLLVMLEGEGVKPIPALGAVFDPNLHDAVMNEDAGPESAGKVTAELRRGYLLHDKVLRPAMVKVGQE